MRTLPLYVFCAALLLAHPLSVSALKSDKDEPIEVEADTAELDDIENVSVYRGDVVVTQGTIRMTGDIMTVYHTEDEELDYLIMEGRPATYRQLPEDSEIYDEAEALRMEYYEIKNQVVLIDEAEVRQEGLTFSGDRIEYDTELSKVRAWSFKGKTKPEDGEDGGSGERVKIIIKKKESPE